MNEPFITLPEIDGPKKPFEEIKTTEKHSFICWDSSSVNWSILQLSPFCEHSLRRSQKFCWVLQFELCVFYADFEDIYHFISQAEGKIKWGRFHSMKNEIRIIFDYLFFSAVSCYNISHVFATHFGSHVTHSCQFIQFTVKNISKWFFHHEILDEEEKHKVSEVFVSNCKLKVKEIKVL